MSYLLTYQFYLLQVEILTEILKDVRKYRKLYFNRTGQCSIQIKEEEQEQWDELLQESCIETIFKTI